MKNWIMDAALFLCVPLLWKAAPTLWKRISGPFNDMIKAVLRGTMYVWHGHGAELESGVEEAASEIKKDIEEVDEESGSPGAAAAPAPDVAAKDNPAKNKTGKPI